MPAQQGQLEVYTLNELKALNKQFLRGPVHHQTRSISSIVQQGWLVNKRSGMRRLYGDGIYFSTGRFWVDASPEIEAHIDFATYKYFETTETLAQYLRQQGINNESDTQQSAIAAHFLQRGTKVIAFPEDQGDGSIERALVGNPFRTVVAYDPAVIHITRISP